MKQSTDQPTRSPDLSRTLFWACLGILALHLYGAVHPNALNWGFHQTGFFSTEIRITILALMALALSTRWQALLLRLVQRISNTQLSFSPPALSSLFLLGASGLVLWQFREQTYFLGDGNLIVRTLPNISMPEEVVVAYRNEPFVGWIIWRLYQLLGSLNVASAAERSFQYLSILSGVGTLALLPNFMKRLTASKEDRLLFGLFIFVSGTAQLFFGYVELYAPSVFVLLLYFWLSLKYIDGTTTLVYPSLAFALLVACHLGMLSMLPSYLYLLFLAWRNGRFQHALLSAASTMLLFSGLVLLSGYRPETLWNNFTGGDKVHLLFPVMTGNIWQPYTLFSVQHFIDYLNLLILVSPFAPVLLFLFVGTFWRRERWADPRWVFFFLTAASGAGFVFLVNPDLGMSRDWDLLSIFLLPAVIFATSLAISRAGQEASLRPSATAVVWMTLLHTMAWVGVNAHDERALERFQTLQDARLWSKGALCNASEELAIYYRDKMEYERARMYFEKFLSIDSTNGRVWISLSNLHKLRKDPAMAIRALERAIQYGITREDVLFELGRLYIQEEQLQAGKNLTEAALKIHPRSARLLNNMGVILAMEQNHCLEALPFFLEAIKADSTIAEPFLNAGLCFQQVNEQSKMRYFWEKFLLLAPNAPQAQEVREKLSKLK
jgi:Tfp pilus assembly protein PilF